MTLEEVFGNFRPKKVLAWWSAGVTSAIACKLAIDKFGKDNVKIIYFKIDSAHSDNNRFKKECELWYGKDIEVRRSPDYRDQFEVIASTRYVNGPAGARCTQELKKKVRFQVEKELYYDYQVFGFEFNKKEINRAIRFSEQYPQAKPIFPLIEKGMDKPACLHYLEHSAGIKRPKMYELGYPNNNCIGCVKGGMGYWNKIRHDFPEEFEKMSQLEQEIGSSCINGVFLKELEEGRGRELKIIMPDCGSFCEIEFENLTHDKVDTFYNQPDKIKELYTY